MRRLFLLAICLCLALVSCAQEEVEPTPEGAVALTFLQIAIPLEGLPPNAPALGQEYRLLPGVGDPVEETIVALLDGPTGEGFTSPFPSGVELLDYELKDGVLRLNLSEAYGGLLGLQLTLADCCLVLTLCQYPGIYGISIEVEGAPLPYHTLDILTPGDIMGSGITSQ